MFTPWERVHRTNWYPASSFESSWMPSMFSHRQFPRMRMLDDDDEFFKDLPQFENEEETVKDNEEKQVKDNEEKGKDDEASDSENHHGYSSYSYSSSSILDKNGQRIENTRRRYEDSNGRLKAIHERRIGDKVHTNVWNRKDNQDKGKHETICSQEDANEFDQLWENTAFGKKKDQKAIKQ